MVCISVAVLSKAGKVILARPFIPIQRARLEGYLQTFPKLLNNNEQHTFIDTEAIRYVYQPMENLYILLITNKSSNIIEDLETLRLFAKLIPEYCGGNTEESVIPHVYDLTMAVDELLTHGGYKENVTLQQIKTFTEMDSHEEKLQKIILESKMNEAREQARRKASDIDQQKAAMIRTANSKYQSYSSHDVVDREDREYSSRENNNNKPSSLQTQNNNDINSIPSPKPRSDLNKSKVKGMQLSKAKKQDDFFEQLNKEEKLAPTAAFNKGATGSASSVGAQQAAQIVQHDSLRILIEEKVVVIMDREGGIKSSEVKGEMKLSIFDPDDAKVTIRTNGPLKENEGFKCRLHPKINKNLWSSNGTLGLADASKGFPVGSDNAPIILKWRKEKLNDNEVPFVLNFWPNVENGQSVVSVEYNADTDLELENVVVSIPCPASDAPEVSNCDGDYKYDQRQKLLTWRLACVNSSNKSGSFEFSVPELDADAFFPIQISFQAQNSLSNMEIAGVVTVDGEKAVNFHAETQVSVEKYTIE